MATQKRCFLIRKQQTNMLVAYVKMCLTKPFKSQIIRIRKGHALNVMSTIFSKWDTDNIFTIFHYGRDFSLISQKKRPNLSPWKLSPPHQSPLPTKFFPLTIKVFVLPSIVTGKGTLKSNKRSLKFFKTNESVFNFYKNKKCKTMKTCCRETTFKPL